MLVSVVEPELFYCCLLQLNPFQYPMYSNVNGSLFSCILLFVKFVIWHVFLYVFLIQLSLLSGHNMALDNLPRNVMGKCRVEVMNHQHILCIS